MVSLNDLVNMEGVVFGCEFADDGGLIDYKAKVDVPDGMAERAAQDIATVAMVFKTLAGAFPKESGMQWMPPRCWTYSGGRLDRDCGWQ